MVLLLVVDDEESDTDSSDALDSLVVDLNSMAGEERKGKKGRFGEVV